MNCLKQAMIKNLEKKILKEGKKQDILNTDIVDKEGNENSNALDREFLDLLWYLIKLWKVIQ